MANDHKDQAAYLNFIEDLNEILMDFDISRLNCS